MWKRDDAVKPAAVPVPSSPAPVSVPEMRTPARDVVHIGKLVVLRGELTGNEDVTVEGQVEGRVDLPENVLTVGPHGRITAEVFAKQVIVLGEITGNVRAVDKVDIRDHGSVHGDISAPKVAIAEGAHFKGSIDMQRSRPAQAELPQAAETTPASEPEASAPQTAAASAAAAMPPSPRAAAAQA